MKRPQHRFFLVRRSKNRKTGPIAVTYTSHSTCPDACPLKSKGCYAETGFTQFPWRQADNGITFRQLMKQIPTLPTDSLVRHNVAGDLPGWDNKLDEKMCLEMATTYGNNVRAFTYTHYPVWYHKHAKHNREVIKEMNNRGFTVNVSANNLKQADQYKRTGLPVVAIVPFETTVRDRTQDANLVGVCPAQVNDSITCKKCKLCAQTYRELIVGFLPHGAHKSHVNSIATAG